MKDKEGSKEKLFSTITKHKLTSWLRCNAKWVHEWMVIRQNQA